MANGQDQVSASTVPPAIVGGKSDGAGRAAVAAGGPGTMQQYSSVPATDGSGESAVTAGRGAGATAPHHIASGSAADSGTTKSSTGAPKVPSVPPSGSGVPTPPIPTDRSTAPPAATAPPPTTAPRRRQRPPPTTAPADDRAAVDRAADDRAAVDRAAVDRAPTTVPPSTPPSTRSADGVATLTGTPNSAPALSV